MYERIYSLIISIHYAGQHADVACSLPSNHKERQKIYFLRISSPYGGRRTLLAPKRNSVFVYSKSLASAQCQRSVPALSAVDYVIIDAS